MPFIVKVRDARLSITYNYKTVTEAVEMAKNCQDASSVLVSIIDPDGREHTPGQFEHLTAMWQRKS